MVINLSESEIRQLIANKQVICEGRIITQYNDFNQNSYRILEDPLSYLLTDDLISGSWTINELSEKHGIDKKDIRSVIMGLMEDQSAFEGGFIPRRTGRGENEGSGAFSRYSYIPIPFKARIFDPTLGFSLLEWEKFTDLNNSNYLLPTSPEVTNNYCKEIASFWDMPIEKTSLINSFKINQYVSTIYGPLPIVEEKEIYQDIALKINEDPTLLSSRYNRRNLNKDKTRFINFINQGLGSIPELQYMIVLLYDIISFTKSREKILDYNIFQEINQLLFNKLCNYSEVSAKEEEISIGDHETVIKDNKPKISKNITIYDQILQELQSPIIKDRISALEMMQQGDIPTNIEILETALQNDSESVQISALKIAYNERILLSSKSIFSIIKSKDKRVRIATVNYLISLKFSRSFAMLETIALKCSNETSNLVIDVLDPKIHPDIILILNRIRDSTEDSQIKYKVLEKIKQSENEKSEEIIEVNKTQIEPPLIEGTLSNPALTKSKNEIQLESSLKNEGDKLKKSEKSKSQKNCNKKFSYNLGRLELECLILDLNNHQEPKYQRLAAQELGESSDIRAFEILAEALPLCHTEIKAEIIEALGILGDRKAIPIIEPFLNSSDVELIKNASYSLENLGFEFPKEKIEEKITDNRSLANHQISDLRLLKQSYYQLKYADRLSLIRNLSKDDKNAIEIIKIALADELQIQIDTLDKIYNLQIYISEKLLFEVISQGLKQSRMKAIQILGFYQKPSSLSMLEYIACNNCRDDTKEAINQIINNYPENAIDALVRILKEKGDTSIRILIIKSLSGLYGFNKESLYLQGLNDRAASVRIESLNSLSSDDINENMIEILKDLYHTETEEKIRLKIKEIINKEEPELIDKIADEKSLGEKVVIHETEVIVQDKCNSSHDKIKVPKLVKVFDFKKLEQNQQIPGKGRDWLSISIQNLNKKIDPSSKINIPKIEVKYTPPKETPDVLNYDECLYNEFFEETSIYDDKFNGNKFIFEERKQEQISENRDEPVNKKVNLLLKRLRENLEVDNSKDVQ